MPMMQHIVSLLLALPVTVRGGASVIRPIANTSSFGGSISGFTFPQLAGSKAQVSAEINNNAAILVFDGENMVHIVNDSTRVHGYPSAKILGTGMSSVSHSKEGILSFTASVATDSSSFVGVFVSSPDLFNSAAVPVITTQGSNTYTNFDSATVAMAKDGKSIMVAFIASTANASTVVKVAIDIATGVVGTPLVLAKTGDIIPGSGGLTFLCMSSPAISESGDVAFFGSHCGEGSGRTVIVEKVRKQRMYRTRTEASHCLNLGGDRVFPGIFVVGEAGLKVVASAATTAPTEAGNEAKFTAFSAPAMGADGSVAFVAETAASLGIYARAAGGNGVRLVANTNTKLSSGAVFGDFPEPPSVGSDGRVAFYAATNGAFSGVYLEPREAYTSKTKTDPISLLTMADSAMGTGIVFIGFAQHSYDQAAGEVAVYLVLDNTAGTDGIYAVKESSTSTVV